MLISGTLIVLIMGGTLGALVATSVILAYVDKRNDPQRRHWKPAESSTHW